MCDSHEICLYLLNQVEQNRQELERLDQQLGRKRTELQLLQDTQDRKQHEYDNVLQDAEADIASKHREIKVTSNYNITLKL